MNAEITSEIPVAIRPIPTSVTHLPASPALSEALRDRSAAMLRAAVVSTGTLRRFRS